MSASAARIVQEVLGVLGEEGFVHHADGQWNWTNESYPADAVSLRSVSSDNFVVVDITHGERRHRRDGLHQRPFHAPREGHLHRRGRAVPGGALRLRGPQGVRAIGRVRLLHRRDHLREGDDPREFETGSEDRDPGSETRTVARSDSTGSRDPRSRTRIPTRRSRCEVARRSPRRVARRRASRRSSSTRTRTSGSRRARSAGAADAHVVLLADGAGARS